MTISAVLDRITQIQSQMQQLSTFDQPAASTSDFSTQLDSAVSSAGSTGRVSADATVGLDTSSLRSDYSTTGAGTTATPTQQAVIDDAKKYLGVPYVWGGTDPTKGLDCSGFVQRVYGDLGISLPRVSGDQARAGTKVDSLADAQPGDILAFGSPVHHVAIYAGNGEMIEAPHTGDHVKIIQVADFGEPVTQIRRVLPSAGASGSSGAATLQDSAAASRAAYDASQLIGARS